MTVNTGMRTISNTSILNISLNINLNVFEIQFIKILKVSGHILLIVDTTFFFLNGIKDSFKGMNLIKKKKKKTGYKWFQKNI